MSIPSSNDDLRRDLTRPALLLAVGKLGILITHEVQRYRKGEIDARELRVRTGAHVGSSAGIISGAAAGIAFGALLPGVGTIIGAFSGAMFGSMAGEYVGHLVAEQLETHLPKE